MQKIIEKTFDRCSKVSSAFYRYFLNATLKNFFEQNRNTKNYFNENCKRLIFFFDFLSSFEILDLQL